MAYVTVTPLPEVKINGAVSGTASICPGNNVTLTASGATTYAWSNDLGTATSVNVSTGGTYTVTGTANGCTNTASVTVTAYDAPNVSISGPTTACSTDAITLTASGASDYVWANNMGSNPSITPTTTGDYTVTGTDSHGCTASATHHLTVNTTPNVDICINNTPVTTTAICEGASTTLTATSNLVNTTYQWSNNLGTNAAVSVSAGGTYSVTGTKDGCSASYTVTVTESATPAVPTLTNTTVSRCGAGEVTVSASSNEGTIVWYASENTQSETATGDNYTFNATNNITYYAAVRNAAGCESARVPVTVTINALPNVTAAAAPAAVCAGSSTTLTAGGANSYAWSTNETGATITVTPTANTTTYTVTGTDANNCTNTATVTVTMNPVPGVPTVASQTACKGSGNVTLTATAGENGTTLRWRTSPTGNHTQGASYTANAVGTYYVSTYNTTTQCESEQVTITVAATPAAPAASPVTLCAAGQATLAVNNPNSDMTYTWYSDAACTAAVGTGASVDVTVSDDTTYYVTAQADGCESAATTVNVTIGEEIAAPTLTTPIYACGGSTILPATDGTHTLTWKSNGTVMTDLNVSIASGSATYTATYEVNGCESQPATVTVTYEEVPTLSIRIRSMCPYHGQRPLRCGRGDAECHFRRNHLLVRDPECGQRLHGHGQHLRGHGHELRSEHQRHDDLLPPRHERRRLSLRGDHGGGHDERPAERDGHGCSGSSLCGH